MGHPCRHRLAVNLSCQMVQQLDGTGKDLRKIPEHAVAVEQKRVMIVHQGLGMQVRQTCATFVGGHLK